ncbi:hypothetical protein AWJ20_335 [Sugiyamaella lignohabitans]|uniref:Uncharacterized protein n=1 Tax=Sugiyamaella lignohabitans TaxID=796027 RepID=A0A167CTU9_9ASCO|nr:uncharacterized protein AWJ20_335 [Sugiyamaella lignohabitans]ANB12099.1 hypothetical protein AWJ20_335 [Sugiyamaella lignohabitans]
MALALSASRTERAISVAPPPGDSLGSKHTLRATDMASCKLRSISDKISLEGPRNRIVQAPGSSHSVKNVKYSSPMSSILNKPHWVPMSDSRISSTRFTIVAPVALAIRLLSPLRTLRRAEILAFNR